MSQQSHSRDAGRSEESSPSENHSLVDDNTIDTSSESLVSQWSENNFGNVCQKTSDPVRRESCDCPGYPTKLDLKAQNIAEQLPSLANSRLLSNEQKLDILSRCPHSVLDDTYNRHVAIYGVPRLPVLTTNTCTSGDLSEETYLPLIEHVEPSRDPTAPTPIYAPYAGHFATSEQARRHRKRTRIAPKSQAPDVERVKRFGRQYWVRHIYEAMIDITSISDGDSSIHRQRFAESAVFEPADLEAIAHHVFDSALAVHERGWNRPQVYHKKVVRGKLTDVSEKSLESRLARICYCLRQKKATVDDAIRGGVTLALLCDNPEARSFTKMSNNTGNRKRSERLRLAKDHKAAQQQDDSE